MRRNLCWLALGMWGLACGSGSEAAGRDGTLGWRILGQPYQDNGPLDGISFEWDYLSIHDDAGAFTGIVGYLVANPRHREDDLGKLVPQGGNVAIVGQWADKKRAAEYKNFGYQGFSAGVDTRSFEAIDAENDLFGRITPDVASNRLRLEGRTVRFEWNLEVADAWPELTAGGDGYTPVVAHDIGALIPELEFWGVDVLWPATRVRGTLTDRDAARTVTIDGVGYRENSFGRWAFNLGGWDFFFLHEPSARVSLVFQTYHYNSVDLDFVDVAFFDGTRLVKRRMMAKDGGLRWWHEAWRFDEVGRQCVPRDTHLAAEDAEYRVEAVAAIGEDEVPLLSDATYASKQYVIFELFPRVSGSIRRKADDSVVTSFQGQGGGEFSAARTQQDAMSEAECAAWGMPFVWPAP